MLLTQAIHLTYQVPKCLSGRVERDLANELSSLALDLKGKLFVNLEPLEKHRLQALSEESHSESKVLVQSFLDEVVALGEIPMENEIEAF